MTADKIDKQAQNSPRALQDVFKRILTLEASLQLADGVHHGRPPKVMQVPTDVPGLCSHEGLEDSKSACIKSM